MYMNPMANISSLATEWGVTNLGLYQLVPNIAQGGLNSNFHAVSREKHIDQARLAFISATFIINNLYALEQSVNTQSPVGEKAVSAILTSFQSQTNLDISEIRKPSNADLVFYFGLMKTYNFDLGFINGVGASQESLTDQENAAIQQACKKEPIMAEFFSLFTNEGRQAVIDGDETPQDLANRFRDFPFVAI